MAVTDAQAGGVVVDSGGGQSPAIITLDASCGKVEVGDLIGYSAALAGWVRADASAAADGTDPIEARFVAIDYGDNTSTEALNTVIHVSQECIVSGRFSGGDIGDPVYASETAGQTTETAPTGAGLANTIIGQLLDASTVEYKINSLADAEAS